MTKGQNNYLISLIVIAVMVIIGMLGGYFYIKSLGEYDVTKGDCKLSLYKLDLTN